MPDIKYLDIKEFRGHGYLQEANRLFFHPLGLALEVMVDPDGNERLGGVWDYRDDPEGMNFGPGVMREDVELRVNQERIDKAKARWAGLGYVIQPVR